MHGRAPIAGVVLVCFVALLRVSEALALCWDSFKRTPAGWVLILRSTKRGFEQKLVVDAPSVMAWLDLYAAYTSSTSSSQR
eukprot:5611544-Amphidinium_carterae.1